MTDLKRRRLEMGLTQVELARLCGCSSWYISDIERGRVNASEKLSRKIKAVLSGERIVIERTAEQKLLRKVWLRDWA